MSDSSLSRWLAFHFYYHERQDHLLEHLLRPTVTLLLSRGEIDSFFFVRFLLGGPHVRLRLRLCGGQHAAVAKVVQGAAEQFFVASPSRAMLAEEKLREVNLNILKSDPAEQDDTIYPNNFLRSAPFHPEIKRYGGPELLPESLAFFAVSSCRVLHFLHREAGDPGPRLLSFAFHLLGTQALGFAKDCQELLGLVCYPVPSWKAAPPMLVQRGDQAFEQQRGSYLQAFRRRIEEMVEGRSLRQDLMAERTLSVALRKVPARRRILSSHLHMTANRLGLKNGEEIYLARLIWRTATELASSEPSFWSSLERLLIERAAPEPSCRSLEGLLSTAFGELGAD